MIKYIINCFNSLVEGQKMEWDTVGDGGLFQKKTEPVIIDGKTVAYVGYVKLAKETKGLPKEEMHFFDADMKRTGYISVIADDEAVLNLENGERMTVTPSLTENASSLARILAERKGITMMGTLFSITLIEQSPEIYTKATMEQLNSGFIWTKQEKAKADNNRKQR